MKPDNDELLLRNRLRMMLNAKRLNKAVEAVRRAFLRRGWTLTEFEDGSIMASLTGAESRRRDELLDKVGLGRYLAIAQVLPGEEYEFLWWGDPYSPQLHIECSEIR